MQLFEDEKLKGEDGDSGNPAQVSVLSGACAGRVLMDIRAQGHKYLVAPQGMFFCMLRLINTSLFTDAIVYSNLLQIGGLGKQNRQDIWNRVL